MSAEATGWVWRRSPYAGERLLVHLAIADVVNDVHDNKFWMKTGKLADKAKVARSTATTVLTDLCARGLLEVVERGVGRGNPTIYRFLMPEESARAARTLRAVGDHESARGARTSGGGKVRAGAPESARLSGSPISNPNEPNGRVREPEQPLTAQQRAAGKRSASSVRRMLRKGDSDDG